MNPEYATDPTHASTDTSPDALYPIAVLMDELKAEDVVLRLNAIRRLSTIALALGPERARDELIPFLEDSVDDDDEVLVALAEELGGLVDCTGGGEHAHNLLTPLEGLATQEETIVREKAVISLNRIASTFTTPLQAEEHLLPLVRRLTEGEWFTARTSACGLYTSAYSQITDETIRTELVRAYSGLCTDETPMVRRAAATNLADLVPHVDKEVAISSLLPLFDRLTTDSQDSVRLLTIPVLIALSNLLGSEGTSQYLLQALRSLCSDSSWRVRFMIAERFVALATAAGPDIVQSDLVAVYASLLRDNEAEVRVAACSQIPGFGKLVGSQVTLERLLPNLQDLVSDTAQHVRSALAGQVPGLSPVLGKEATIEHLLPLFLRLLRDDSPDVRLAIISKMDQVNEVIGVELLAQSLLPAIVELAEDKQWRVRLAIIEYIPLLSRQLGVEFFNAQLRGLCLAWLSDPVYSIREAATLNLRKLTEIFGSDWAAEKILPEVLEGTGYLRRMTTVLALATLVPVLSPQTIESHVLPAVHGLVNDPIPNIRFNVAKCLEALVPVVKGDQVLQGPVADKLRPMLGQLEQDSDADVRFYATRALHII
ncbi:phospho protein phosphatase A [Piptocephalis cylindrospora]|uniref:Phospho protein phosphatase A n=1 Tax=Piptocephalis cylindrospora TaxID=1907219 RepID=A0A4P9Y874_9FUNG|nr:phospho protein phosphatase A [Piptocephalis cylindrospora]|eukprot:RKP14170.1 phospho protein phosphatase A [Piptocephalis cylindrospora]